MCFKLEVVGWNRIGWELWIIDHCSRVVRRNAVKACQWPWCHSIMVLLRARKEREAVMLLTIRDDFALAERKKEINDGHCWYGPKEKDEESCREDGFSCRPLIVSFPKDGESCKEVSFHVRHSLFPFWKDGESCKEVSFHVPFHASAEFPL